ncbi:hypothetical protein Q2E61_14285 [Microbulbifer thermotolerans]|uniref:hypothetical protein n=1 Tax=Microbulbifer thermotolerans TaxID=252514 RepID=UPI002673B53B|nr:hypothetical protein [Microbulbifer thermotolerans]WKT60062.1 hypothetical protein Q2E61_14285 [Microbulbifer thermotolerans]
MEQYNNPECKKEFYVSSIGGGVPGGKELEPVIFSYCGTTVRIEMTSATFTTRKFEGFNK